MSDSRYPAPLFHPRVIPSVARDLGARGLRRSCLAPPTRSGPSLTLLMTRPHPALGHLLPLSREKALAISSLARIEVGSALAREAGEGGRRPDEGRVIEASTALRAFSRSG